MLRIDLRGAQVIWLAIALQVLQSVYEIISFHELLGQLQTFLNLLEDPVHYLCADVGRHKERETS